MRYRMQRRTVGAQTAAKTDPARDTRSLPLERDDPRLAEWILARQYVGLLGCGLY